MPFYPDDVKPITEPDNNDIDENNNNRQGNQISQFFYVIIYKDYLGFLIHKIV